MEKINLSEPDGTRERWMQGSIRETLRLGRVVSVSEYVRRAVEAYSEQGEREATHRVPGGTRGSAARFRQGMYGGTQEAEDYAVVVRESTQASEVAGGHRPVDAPTRETLAHSTRQRSPQKDGPRSAAVGLLNGGAVKREAKAPNTGESDPAAPPYRLQDLMGTRGQELAGLRQPVTKESQLKRGRK